MRRYDIEYHHPRAFRCIEVVGLWLSGRVATYRPDGSTWNYLASEPWDASSYYWDKLRCRVAGHDAFWDCIDAGCRWNRGIARLDGWPSRFHLLRWWR